MNWILLALVAYLVLQLGIGAWLAPKIQTEDDYLVAGRKLGYPLTIFSIFATWFGAETCISSAGRAYEQGFSLTTAEPFAYGVTLMLTGLIFAVPIWRLKLTTMADLFRLRFGPGVERLAAVLLIPPSVLWAAAQLRGFGHVLTTITDLEISTAVAAAAAFCILYTVLGGLLADAITDLVQGSILVVGLVGLVVAVVVHLGGLEAALASVEPSRLALVGPDVTPSFLGLLEEYAIPIAGSVVAVELISRVIAARSPEVARNGAVMAGGLYIAVGILPVFLGLVAYRLVPSLPDSEQFLPALALEMLPTAGYIIFVGALISAILSTVDTILLVAGGLAAHNIVAPIFGVTNERSRLRLARFGVGVFGMIALALALGAAGVAELVEESSSFGTAGALVVVSFGLFTRIGGPRAAVASLLGGLGVYVSGGLLSLPYPFITSLAAAVVLYLLGASTEGRQLRTA
ncbi:MAG: sodium:solute symporter [Gemmatimonadales bacterium]